jgi:hypothetical protein
MRVLWAVTPPIVFDHKDLVPKNYVFLDALGLEYRELGVLMANISKEASNACHVQSA